MYSELREAVCDANRELQRRELVIYSWGNVSAIDRSKSGGVIAIKPSGVPYDELTPETIVVLDLEGNILEGDLRPSSDTPTHIELYRGFPSISAICHTHSPNATMWAQACRELPCFGTTHADYFYGTVPVTQSLGKPEIQADYERNTGKAIVRRFETLDPVQMPAVLVANHGPFTWGPDPARAVENSVVLEQCAVIGMGTVLLRPEQQPIDSVLLDKHYLRKHGANAYYGQ